MSHYTVLETVVEQYDAALLESALNKVINSSEFAGLTLENNEGVFVLRHPDLEKYRTSNLRFVRQNDGRYIGEVDHYLVREFANRVIGRINQEYVIGATRKILHRNSTIRESAKGKSRQLVVTQR